MPSVPSQESVGHSGTSLCKCAQFIFLLTRTVGLRRKSKQTGCDRRNRNVVDYQCDLDRDVGVGNGVLLHDEWIYTHPTRNRSRNHFVAVD